MKRKPGEIKCPHCEFGRVIGFDDDGYCGTKECSFCKGKVYLDWIERVVGVKKVMPNYMKKDYFMKTALKVQFSTVYQRWKETGILPWKQER
jgi:hypothetical protein